jgi:hypothetical protein
VSHIILLIGSLLEVIMTHYTPFASLHRSHCDLLKLQLDYSTPQGFLQLEKIVYPLFYSGNSANRGG